MTDQIVLESNLEREDYEVVAELRQSQSGYDNPTITLARILDGNSADVSAGAIVSIYSDGRMTQTVLLGDQEAEDALRNSDKYLAGIASDIAYDWSDGDPLIARLGLMEWGILDPQDVVVSDDYEGDCLIVVEHCYNDHSPISYVTDDESHDVRYFSPAQAARTWINAATDGPYHLDHNEADRPTYYILPA